jgi:hypothetical protein
MHHVVTKWEEFTEDKKGDDIFNFWDGSQCDINPPMEVPVQVVSDKKNKAFRYAPRGMSNLYLKNVLGVNPGSHDGFMQVIMAMLNVFTHLLASGQYPFMRGDINVYMAWLKVNILFGILLTRSFSFVGL